MTLQTKLVVSTPGVPQLSRNAQAPAGPGVAPGIATPGARPVDPPEVLDQLKTEAKADALKIKQLLHSNLKDAAVWEIGKRTVEGRQAAWAIIAKWGARPREAGYQGRGGYMTPFDFFVAALQTQTFTVSEWGVDQWTNAFELICERLSDANVLLFKAWVQTQGKLFKDEKPRGMIHFDVGQVLVDAGEVYLELGGAFLTGGSSLVAKIVKWLAVDLPKLLKQAKSVIDFVEKIRDVKFDDVTKFLNPTGIGQLLGSALFGQAVALPTLGEAQDEKKDKEAGAPSEAGGLIALLRKVLTVVDVVKSSYRKVAEAVNAGLAKLDITKQGWFEAFSMVYAGIVHAVKTVTNPGAALGNASQTLRGIVGGFFETIKEKIAGIASGIKTGLDLAGRGKKLIAALADKAVEMVVNFLIKHNPSAVIKTALRVLETAADQPIVQLLRNKVPYGDEIFTKISESSVVRGLLSPLERPVAAVSEMTETAAGEATAVVTKVEQQALALVGDGATMVSELAGVPVPQGDASAQKAEASGAAARPTGAGKGASGFLGALKQVIHAGLLELGTLNLVRHGKQLGKAAVEKGTSAAKSLAARSIRPEAGFKAGREDHELSIEERRNDAVVLFATEETELEAKLASFDSAIAAMPGAGPQKRTAEADVGRLRASYREVKDSWAAARASIPDEPLGPGVAVRSKRDIAAVERNFARGKRRIVDELKRLMLLHAPAVGDFVLDLDTTGLSGQAKNAAGGALSLNYIAGRIQAVERATGWRPVSAGILRGGDESLINLGSKYGLMQYVRYHIHGPGLGQEHYPIPLAPTRANQFANSAVEGFMRERRDASAAVEFKVSYCNL